MRIALIVSHPVQHFCPQYVSWSKIEQIQFKVFFASRLGIEKYYDANFKKSISWSNLKLELFDHEFLNQNAVIQSDKNIDASELDSKLLEYQPDFLIVYGYFQKLQRRAYNWAVNNNVKLVYISDAELKHTQSFIKKFIKYFYLKNYFKKINYFLTVGNSNEEYYKYYGVASNKLIEMHFPIDIVTYENAYLNRSQLRQELRHKFQIDENDFVITNVGKLVPWKNQDHLIRMVKNLNDQGIKIHLLIVGSGEMMEKWKTLSGELIDKYIHFAGFINIDQLPAYYAASDVYVHPASLEPHSIAISEAIFMGCPIVCSDTCGSYGVNDDVQEGINGYIYPFGDIEKLTKLIIKLNKDKNSLIEFSSNSHIIATRFQKISHGDALEELISFN